jgi:hypothetical protein
VASSSSRRRHPGTQAGIFKCRPSPLRAPPSSSPCHCRRSTPSSGRSRCNPSPLAHSLGSIAHPGVTCCPAKPPPRRHPEPPRQPPPATVNPPRPAAPPP